MLHQEMVEPLEETRTELIFATEPLLSSLELSIPGSARYSPLVELDEVEVRELNRDVFRYISDSLCNRYRKGFSKYAKDFRSCTHRPS
jgi:hypothetical protein